MDEERIPVTEDGRIYIQPEEEKLDLLNRDDFVNQVMSIMDIVSTAKGSCTLAIDGKWGSGKTFVLDKLEYKLKREQDGNRYLVFHYNCWQYDYYDEPLIAIVSTMIDSIKSSVNILPDEVKTNIKAIVNTVGGFIWDVFKESGKNYIKEKTGLDIEKVSERFISEKNALSESEAEKTIDDYQTFNMVMSETREKLSMLAEDITLVCVVDELDRCLPSYAIKVMERLHHLFYGVKNSVTIMAVDKAQLVNTIKQIYGDNINTNEYLRKFIDYEMTLDTGIINEKFTQKYKSYISLFDSDAIEDCFSVEEFCVALFSGMEIRKQEHLLERIQTVHKILYRNEKTDEKKDYSFMCFELLMVYMEHHQVNAYPLQFKNHKFELMRNNGNFTIRFAEYISDLWEITDKRRVSDNINYNNSTKQTRIFYNKCKITMSYLLMWYWYRFFESEDVQLYNYRADAVIVLESGTPHYEKYCGYIEEFKKIKALLAVIK